MGALLTTAAIAVVVKDIIGDYNITQQRLGYQRREAVYQQERNEHNYPPLNLPFSSERWGGDGLTKKIYQRFRKQNPWEKRWTWVYKCEYRGVPLTPLVSQVMELFDVDEECAQDSVACVATRLTLRDLRYEPDPQCIYSNGEKNPTQMYIEHVIKQKLAKIPRTIDDDLQDFICAAKNRKWLVDSLAPRPRTGRRPLSTTRGRHYYPSLPGTYVESKDAEYQIEFQGQPVSLHTVGEAIYKAGGREVWQAEGGLPHMWATTYGAPFMAKEIYNEDGSLRSDYEKHIKWFTTISLSRD